MADLVDWRGERRVSGGGGLGGTVWRRRTQRDGAGTMPGRRQQAPRSAPTKGAALPVLGGRGVAAHAHSSAGGAAALITSSCFHTVQYTIRTCAAPVCRFGVVFRSGEDLRGPKSQSIRSIEGLHPCPTIHARPRVHQACGRSPGLPLHARCQVVALDQGLHDLRQWRAGKDESPDDPGHVPPHRAAYRLRAPVDAAQVNSRLASGAVGSSGAPDVAHAEP